MESQFTNTHVYKYLKKKKKKLTPDFNPQSCGVRIKVSLWHCSGSFLIRDVQRTWWVSRSIRASEVLVSSSANCPPDLQGPAIGSGNKTMTLNLLF